MPFEITKEELLELAAQKLVDEYCEHDTIHSKTVKMIEEKIKNVFESGLKERIELFLTNEMERLVSQEITPVDIWGDKIGSPTTIRAQLAIRAKEFWDVRVNDDGRPAGSYGGTPRHEHLMKKIMQDEFAKSVKQNADVIVSAFKAALTADATRLVKEHIDNLIKVK